MFPNHWRGIYLQWLQKHFPSIFTPFIPTLWPLQLPRIGRRSTTLTRMTYKVLSEFSIFLERHRFAYKRKKRKSNTLFHKVIHNTNPNPFCNRHTYITNTYFVSEYCTLQSNVQLRFNLRT